MIYGITPNGFSTKSFDVLKREQLSRWQASFGDIDSKQDGAFGQIADSESYAHAEVWQVWQDVYLGMNPNTATGSQLSRLLALQGMTPRGASSASVDCICGGDIGTTIPQGSQVTHSPSGYRFALDEDLLLSTNFVNRFEFKVNDALADGAVIGFTITSESQPAINISVTTDVANGLSTATEVANALVTQLTNNSVTADISEAHVDESDSTLVVATTFSPYRTIAISVLLQGTLSKIWQNGHFTALTTGVFITAPHTVNNVEGVVGWTDADNIISGTTGSDAETDSAIRRRLERYKQYGSTGSRLALESKIWQDVPNISNVRISENNTSTADDYGRPAHSMHCIVDGGDEQSIANIIAQNIPAGINSYGSVSKNVTVSWQTEPYVVHFDRVGLLFGHIKVTVNKVNNEEVVPSNARQLIREAIFNEVIKVSTLGADIVTQKYVGVVYQACAGLLDITVEASVTGRPTGIDPAVKEGNSWSYNPDTYSSGYNDELVVVAPYDKVEWRDGFDRITVEGVI